MTVLFQTPKDQRGCVPVTTAQQTTPKPNGRKSGVSNLLVLQDLLVHSYGRVQMGPSATLESPLRTLGQHDDPRQSPGLQVPPLHVTATLESSSTTL